MDDRAVERGGDGGAARSRLIHCRVHDGNEAWMSHRVLGFEAQHLCGAKEAPQGAKSCGPVVSTRSFEPEKSGAREEETLAHVLGVALVVEAEPGGGGALQQ